MTESRDARKLVLIVDDDEDIREALQAALESAGYETATASNGREGLEYLRKNRHRPCVALVDLMMPVMDGNEMLAQLAAERIDVSVILLTASHTAQPLPGTRHLPKPVTLGDLLAVVREACNGTLSPHDGR